MYQGYHAQPVISMLNADVGAVEPGGVGGGCIWVSPQAGHACEEFLGLGDTGTGWGQALSGTSGGLGLDW